MVRGWLCGVGVLPFEFFTDLYAYCLHRRFHQKLWGINASIVATQQMIAEMHLRIDCLNYFFEVASQRFGDYLSDYPHSLRAALPQNEVDMKNMHLSSEIYEHARKLSRNIWAFCLQKVKNSSPSPFLGYLA